MKAGDIVDVYKRTHWGSLSMSTGRGLLIRRTYTAHQTKYSRWAVLVKGAVVELRQDVLRVR
jgi:hypothetical protein